MPLGRLLMYCRKRVRPRKESWGETALTQES